MTRPLLKLGESYVFFADSLAKSDGFFGPTEHLDLHSGQIKSDSAIVAPDAAKYIAALATAGQNCRKK